MWKKWTFVSLCLLMMLGYAQGSPLVPYDVDVDVFVNGAVGMSPPCVPAADYNLEGSGSSFVSGGISVESGVDIGDVPGCPHYGHSGASASVQFEQIAINEYILTLSTTAIGELFRDDSVDLDEGGFEAHAHANVTSGFAIFGLPGQQHGDAATLYLELEHFGVLSRANSAMAGNAATLVVESPDGGYDYSIALETPPFPANPAFQNEHFMGVRDVFDEWVIETTVGSHVLVTAELSSGAWGDLFDDDYFDYIDANSDFESGLRLHMTVMPEPITVSFVLLGMLAIKGRQN